MQPSDHPTLRDEARGASSSAMDVDLTPPKKRIKSGQSSRRASAEPAHGWDVDHGAEKVGVAVKVEEDVNDAASALALLAEASSSVPTPPSDTTATPQPPSKKKKSSTTKKEASSSNSTPKPKKTSATKKASTSHSDATSSSRTKPKPEPQSPPPPPIILDPEAEDEDTTLYCTCQRRQDDVEGGMIMCDRCEQWYHYRCMQITEDDAELVDQFICPPCHTVTGQETTYKTACARGGCRRAAMEPFSKYCSDRCGVLMVTERMKGLKVDRKAAGVLERDRRVGSARKGEGLTRREVGWERVMKEDVLVPKRNIGLAEAYAMMVEEEAEKKAPAVNGSAAVNGTSTSSLPTNEPSSLSLISIDEQLSLITRQLHHLDLSKTLLNARLDRIDLRSTLLHLVSDRVPTLPLIGSTSTTADADAEAEDEEMPETSKKSKKKSSKSKKSTSDAGAGPRCGYDQRLQFDDSTFDSWAHTLPGSSILAHDLPLDGSLDDSPDGGMICALAKRKCRRHLDWSNLCELALDAEKASLNADSRVLTQRKLVLVEKKAGLEVEREAVKELIEKERERERRRREERDRDVAMRMANEGTRRA